VRTTYHKGEEIGMEEEHALRYSSAELSVTFKGGLVAPPYSRNPHYKTVVVRRAQLETKPGHP